MRVRFIADADLNYSIVSDAAEELLLIWSATEAEEWENRIYSLPV
jgi:hypothetical protein